MAPEREAEHAFFLTGSPPVVNDDIIRQVDVIIDKDGDFLFSFETSQHRYAMAVIVDDNNKLGWRECQALFDVMSIAERGTSINNETFIACVVGILREKYGQVRPPFVQQGHLIAVLHPPRGAFNVVQPNTIMDFGISLDSDGDFILKATTKDGHTYSVCLERFPRGTSLTTLDCEVFMKTILVLEPGNHISKQDFLAFGLLLRTTANRVTATESVDKRTIYFSVLATYEENEGPLPPLLASALQEIEESQGVAGSGSTATSPYPGITYSRALKQSGQAQVYAGRTSNGEDVAVKVFSKGSNPQDARETFKAELCILLKMDVHPNVVEVVDFFESPQPALITKFIPGEDLMDYMKKNGPFDEAAARKLICGIAQGLCHLHSYGIIHRDLKSSNILRRADGTAVIIDLGVGSTIQKRESLNPTMTIDQLCTAMASANVAEETNGLKGTIPWMSPEMIRDQRWSEKTDVYAFGIIMWEIFSGLIPYSDLEGARLLFAIVAGDRPPLSKVSNMPEDLIQLMQKCWHNDPNERPSMTRVRDILMGNDPKEIFQSVDTDNSGSLDFGEFVIFLQRYAPGKVSPAEMPTMFSAIDTDNSGGICLDEFEAFWSDAEKGGLNFALSNLSEKNVDL